MTPDWYVLAAILLVYTVGTAIYDWRAKRLPNWLTVSMCAAGLVFHLVAGGFRGGWAGAGLGLAHALGGFALGFGLLFILWVIGTGGGGDVKYTAALGAWLGAPPTFYVILISIVLVAMSSVGVLVYEAMRLGFGKTQARYVTAGGKGKRGVVTEEARQAGMVKRRLMPWAVPAGIATWLVLAWQLMQATG